MIVSDYFWLFTEKLQHNPVQLNRKPHCYIITQNNSFEIKVVPALVYNVVQICFMKIVPQKERMLQT